MAVKKLTSIPSFLCGFALNVAYKLDVNKGLKIYVVLEPGIGKGFFATFTISKTGLAETGLLAKPAIPILQP
jgi:hypothetical protein